MTLPLILAPSAAPALSTVWLDGSRSRYAAALTQPAACVWSVTSGGGTLLETQGERVRLTLPASGTTTVRLTVTTGGVAAQAETTLTSRGAWELTEVYPVLLFAPSGKAPLLLPRGGVTADLYWRDATRLQPAPVTLLRALDPLRLTLTLRREAQEVDLPFTVEVLTLDHWRLLLEGAPAGEKVMEARVEKVRVIPPVLGHRPQATLRNNALAIKRVLWTRTEDGSVEELGRPAYEHVAGSPTLWLHESYGDAARAGRLPELEVFYNALDLAYQSGWWTALGLGPYSRVWAHLRLTYGQDVTPEPLWLDVPLELAGSLRLAPHFDVWQDLGNHQALLREPYNGILLK